MRYCNESNFQELSKKLAFKTEKHGWKLLTEPPVTFGMDLESACREKPMLLNYPCHSQTVELAVKTTSESVGKTTDYKSQLGDAFCTIESRRKIKGKISRKSLLGSSETPKRSRKRTIACKRLLVCPETPKSKKSF